jgi:hypothetical protein
VGSTEVAAPVVPVVEVPRLPRLDELTAAAGVDFPGGDEWCKLTTAGDVQIGVTARVATELTIASRGRTAGSRFGVRHSTRIPSRRNR